MNALNLLYERQRQQYQVARQNVQIINKRCHELKVQIANLRKLSPEAVPPERIEEAERAARLYDANRNTGNEVLDVVLTEKSLLCESRGIQLNAVANGSCLGFIEAGDLYALFANALDHAVESAVQTARPECRVIDLLVCVRQGFVVVNIISPLRPPEKQANRSTQYELKVIRRIVQKYKGTLTLEEQGEFFAEKIIFPLQNKLRKRQPPQNFRKRKSCGGFLFVVCWIHLFVKNIQIYRFTFGSRKPNAHAKRPIFAGILRNAVALIK